jgi:hypothetical protein
MFKLEVELLVRLRVVNIGGADHPALVAAGVVEYEDVARAGCREEYLLNVEGEGLAADQTNSLRSTLTSL